MAASSARKTNNSTAKSTTKSKTSTKSSSRSSAGRKKADVQLAAQDSALFHEIGLIVLFAAMVILFCCNFGIIGPVGNAVSAVLFGLFGLPAYAVPVLLFLAAAFWFANEGNPNAARKLIAGIVLFVMLGIVCDLLTANGAAMEEYNVALLYGSCSEEKTGGGVLMGSLSFLFSHYLGTIGTVLLVLLCSVVSLILLTEKSLLGSVKRGSERVREFSKEDAARREEYAQARRENAEMRKEQARLRRQEQEEQARLRRQEQEEQRARRGEERRLKEEERRLREEEEENEKILRMEKKVSGVILDTALPRPEDAPKSDDMHEIVISEEEMEGEFPDRAFSPEEIDYNEMQVRSVHQVMINEEPEDGQELPDMLWEGQQEQAWESDLHEFSIQVHKEDSREEEFDEEAFIRELMEEDEPEFAEETDIEKSFSEFAENPNHTAPGNRTGESPDRQRPVAKPGNPERPGDVGNPAAGSLNTDFKIQADTKIKEPKKYMFPPISLLQKGASVTGDSARELRETAKHLQQTLATFGVKVTITDISQGPSVTRYELQPEQGVKVSKIVGLTDDIKLNLAATDIRIEAPIPGKAAVGIEVPNKENTPVALRDLLETEEFKKFPSNIAFAVGKDIGGKVVVSDIAKMPHMLIAGATGSGKSVCINTLIMSILYKAHPDDVKLIMVDPKVVELSVYNGIPHLLIPVVTDPKKASAALHWGVAEMEDRYRKFADYNVRDLKGYNKKIESMKEDGNGEALKKLPQIVIIVDELADLMMVCPGEVEESICRLAQLARAAGIHLIIATQRPSVDVITGLIKANMPSRVAFSVSSGVDSRTILDMVGAEKLLGKGDMLFYPQGYSKPARIQGAFVSDKEVSDVVDFLKNQSIGNTYSSDIEERIKNMNSQSGGGSSSSGDNEVDELFERAGRFIIDKDKASIGALQRALKIGFNRAARIMDQLCQYGVVSEEEGTKPRKILMSPEQFEQLLEEV